MVQHYIHKRESGIYYFVMNVPKSTKGKFTYKQVWRSLRTRDKFEASRIASRYISDYSILFRQDSDNLHGDSLEVVKKVSSKLGVTYRDFEMVCNAPISESVAIISSQLNSLQNMKSVTKSEVAALGGAIKLSALSMPKLFERFKQLAPEKVSGSSPHEVKRKWRRFELATEDFERRMPGLSDVLKIEVRHATEYRGKLIESVNDGTFKSDVVKKRLLWLKTIFDVVFTSDYPTLTNPVGNLKRFKIDDASKRKPFTEKEINFIKRELIESKISDEAKAIIILGQYTGCSVKELILLESADIKLDANIPHINIQPNSSRKKVKNGGSRHRSIPLIGEALEIMRGFPGGFPDYRNAEGPRRMNSAMSDFFAKRVPGKGHYSFRHRIDDLLKNSKCDLGIKAGVMGHTLAGNNSYYGEGYELGLKAEALAAAIEYSIKISEGS
ncbi:DUF6538 domain-containing protein [Agrobacterium larrymoorei]|uniref:DUF6538 domain-containing protein n=1 Tax=Agrobacterium larrymoorei TaxID=160699 RepID=A0AAF0HB54_9HYPH|nr:DUF6538 domain-containing protein [Agrobacterium larrymoorei]WHA43216.1 hypothetical protein CFBP5477_018380 [Agrobacterium larrymoorei]